MVEQVVIFAGIASFLAFASWLLIASTIDNSKQRSKFIAEARRQQAKQTEKGLMRIGRKSCATK